MTLQQQQFLSMFKQEKKSERTKRNASQNTTTTSKMRGTPGAYNEEEEIPADRFLNVKYSHLGNT